MNKWTLLAACALLAVLGVCYTMLAHPQPRLAPPGVAETAEEEAPEDDPGEQPGGAFALDDEGQPTGRVAALAPSAAKPASGSGVEMLEDDEENGVTVDAGEVLDDEEGVLEPASPPKNNETGSDAP
jgi:hypothetical protein